MKTRRTKFLLSFLAVALLGFAMVNAYTFEVTNRDPFGTLNLSTLMIKPDVNSPDTMLLSGTTLRIKTAQGKLKVNKICNEAEGSAEECIEFSNLGNGGNGSGITAGGTTGDYCYLLNDGNLNCDDTKMLKAITDAIAPISAALASIGSPSDATIKIYVSGTYLDEFTLNGGAKDIDIPLGDGNITISGAQILDGRETFICTQSGTDNLECNLDPSTLGEGGPLNVDGQHGRRCRYMCSSLTVNGNPVDINLNDLPSVYQYLNDLPKSPKPEIKRDGCEIKCTQPEPSGGGSLWQGTNTISPKEANTSVAINGGNFSVEPDQLTQYKNLPDFKVDTAGIRMFGGSPFTRATSDERLMRGLSIYGPILAGTGGNYIYMYADGDSVNDPNRSYEIMGENELAIGTRNGAFLYFTKTTGTYQQYVPLEYSAGPNGTIARTQVEGAQSCPVDYGKGGSSIIIKDGDDGGKGANTDGGSTATSTTTLGGLFGGLPDKCSATNAVVPVGHERHSTVIPDPNLDEDDIYETLMVGVNTDRPRATLDVNGSIRVGNNCVPMNTTCTAETAGTMMYLERKDTYFGSLVICLANGIHEGHHPATGEPTTTVGYSRYDVTRGIYLGAFLYENDEAGFSISDGSCDLPRPSQNSTYIGVDNAGIPAEL